MSDAPERIWLSAPDEVWFEDGEGRTEYTRADIAERQIAELRAELNANPRWKPKAEELAVKLVAAEAENARLKALPLKDEVERVLEDIANSDDIDNALDPARNKRVARALLSRLRAGEQEVWRLPEGTLAVHGKDVVIAYDDFKDAHRAFNILENVIGAAPSEQGGDRP